MAKALETYRAKRDFTKTPELAGAATRGAGDAFVFQKHAARRLHYDLRLELDGVMKSWAVAKGPSLVPGEKRLAVQTEDHPMEYNGFEGVIPQGEYGGGTVMIWDRGRWIPEEDPHKGLAKGHLSFRLEGGKLSGAWHLVRMRRREREKRDNWLLIKSEDAAARTPDEPDILDEAPLSVATERSMEEIAAQADRVWSSKSGEVPAAKPDGNGAARPRSRAKNAGKPAAIAPTGTPEKATAPRAKARCDPGGDQAGDEPLPDFVPPCLATAVAAAPRGRNWVHEIKFDGYRLQARLEAGAVKLLTRNGHDWTGRFPDIAKALARLPAETALLDGEAVVEDERGVSSFSALQQDLGGRGGEAVSRNALYFAFDLLHLDGASLLASPLVDRKTRLQELLAEVEPGRLRYSEHVPGEGDAMVRHACRLGLEGIVSKRADAPYRPGRGESWLKIKCTRRDEFVVAGYVPSTVSQKAIGSLVLGYHAGKTLVHAGRVGTGFTESLARDLHDALEERRAAASPFAEKLSAEALRGVRWVRPELVAEIEHRGWTGDGLLRHASFKGLREDKEAAEVVRERPKGGGTASRGGRTVVAGVQLTHPERVLWQEQGLTKQGLAEFYAEIADWVLPQIVGRPLSLVRCPSGAGKGCFFQKHAWAGLNPAIRTVAIGGDDEPMLAVDDLAGLVGLVQAGVLEIHPWGSTADEQDHPDRLIFDLDPGEDVPWERVIEAAREVRERLRADGLESFVKTTGGKGLHVVAPIVPDTGWDDAKEFCRNVAARMAADSPARYVATMAKKIRAGRVFVDYLRNGRGATAVAAYSTRARPGAPVATPLGWDELAPEIRGNHFTVANLPARLSRLRRDPWAEMAEIRQSLRNPDAAPARKRGAKRRA